MSVKPKSKAKTTTKTAAPKAKAKKAMKAKNLVQSWLEVELDHNGKTLADALRSLNTALGSAHTHSRVREWETNRNGRGERLPRKVRVYMTKVTIKDILRDCNLNADKLPPRAITQLCERLN